MNGALIAEKGASRPLKHGDKFVVGNREFRFDHHHTGLAPPKEFAPAGPEDETADFTPLGFSQARRARMSLGIAAAVRTSRIPNYPLLLQLV